MVRELGIGGCERDLAKIAIHIDRSRFEPHAGAFVTEGLRTQELRRAGVPIVEFPVRSLREFATWVSGFRSFGAYVRRHKIALVHAFDSPTSIFAPIAAKLHRVPHVASAQLSFRELNSSVERRLLRIADRLADRVVVNSQAVGRHLVQDEGVPENKVFLCYNGVDTGIFHPVSEPRPRALEGASLVIGTVAALRQEKAIHLLIEAFAKVCTARPGMKLLIVGSGTELPRLQETARSLGIGADTIFEPARSEVADAMRLMDIFVLTSRSESFPNALLEAMACGCCPVASSVGGVPELVQDSDTGLLFRSGDSADLAAQLQRVVTDERLRQRLAEGALQSAIRNFPLRSVVERTEALYSSLLEGSAIPAGYPFHGRQITAL